MKRKPFALRLPPKIFDAIKRWADDDMRSMNAQIEFLLTRALQGAGRLRPGEEEPDEPPNPKDDAPSQA